MILPDCLIAMRKITEARGEPCVSIHRNVDHVIAGSDWNPVLEWTLSTFRLRRLPSHLWRSGRENIDVIEVTSFNQFLLIGKTRCH
jgi:hypothetical protein